MKTLIKLFMVGALALTQVANAEVKTEFGGYARAGIGLGRNVDGGTQLWTGFANHNRLQEGQYFELSGKAHLSPDARFVVTLANGGDSFHYTGTWPGNGFAVRNLYFEWSKLPDAPNMTLWSGSRMYRGNDIYLLDDWLLDDHNMVGFGLQCEGTVSSELAIGAHSGSTYTAGPGATLDVGNSQRYLLIHKLSVPMGSDRKLKTNFELHYLPKATVTYNATTAMEAPSGYGVALGAQTDLWKGQTLVANLAYGDVTGALETFPSSFDVSAPLNLQKKAGSAAGVLALSGAYDFQDSKWGYLYAVVLNGTKPAGSSAGWATTGSIRPLYAMTEHFRLGFEVDATYYLAALNSGSDVSYLQLSPMLEYAMNKNVWGSPKFRLIASNAIYADNRPYVAALNLGFEVWF